MASAKRDFEKFYRQHFDKVYRFIFFRVNHNQELAEDLVSEIFLKALDHFADFDPQKSTSAWLMTIASNHLKNFWRDLKPSLPLPGEGDAEGGEEEGDAKWLKGALIAEQKNAAAGEVFELLAALESDSERKIVTFHYLFGYTYAEIGSMLSLSEGAVKVAAHRALKKLRILL